MGASEASPNFYYHLAYNFIHNSLIHNFSENLVDPFDGTKPRFSRPEREVSLRVNLSKPLHFMPGGVEGLTFVPIW